LLSGEIGPQSLTDCVGASISDWGDLDANEEGCSFAFFSDLQRLGHPYHQLLLLLLLFGGLFPSALAADIMMRGGTLNQRSE
jgi:hypothetical protein